MSIKIEPMDPNSDGAKIAKEFAKERQYPKDYKGPKAGLSDNQEWLEVTEFQAFKYIRFKIWNYSDFDCWLGARDSWHYTRGGDDTQKAFEEMQKSLRVR